jgi:hypothetical protein
MSTRYNNGSHYENHQRAAELHDLAAHAHRTAEERRGKQDHLADSELSRQLLEHSENAHKLSLAANHHGGHPVSSFGHNEIAARAHQIWVARGRPEGSAEEDWFRAAEELRSGVPAVDPGSAVESR